LPVSIGLLNALMLFGLAAVAVPVLIHLFNRRRCAVVDWGAMQFLQVSPAKRRRLLLDELLLLALRMLLLAVLVLALASPYVAGAALARLGNRPSRAIVLVFDGSASMTYLQGETSAHTAAQRWALDFLHQLQPNDRVALLAARHQPVLLLAPTHDHAQAAEALRQLPAPGGGCDLPAAVRSALDILAQSQEPARTIVVLTDGQRHGWADEATLLRWSLLAESLGQPGSTISVVNLDSDRPPDPPNWSLTPLRASRAIAVRGQKVVLHSALQLHGQAEYHPPHRLFLEVDGQLVADVAAPATAQLDKHSQVPLQFEQRFQETGAHVVSLVVAPDLPLAQRPPGYVVRDRLPADNRQDFVVDILPALPVLLVDGGERSGADFLRDALAPARDPTPTVLLRVVAALEFTGDQLHQNVGPGPATRPRVVVLADVPQLTRGQQQAIERFLQDGGGVLVALGERVVADHYNGQLHAQGWLPAKLERLAGDEADSQQAVRPLPGSFLHPALELFRDTALGSLAEARFPRWWKLHAPEQGAGATVAGLLTGGDPFLVEKAVGQGRVLLCAVPLSNAWRTNLADLPAFAPLVHELIYYLAGTRGTEHNLQPGAPLVYRFGDPHPATVALTRPGGTVKQLALDRSPLVVAETLETGVYRLDAHGAPRYYAVQPDPREADLTPCSAADRERVARLVPLTYASDPARLLLGDSLPRLELWWLLLAGVIALLCGEVWLTRRIVLKRG